MTLPAILLGLAGANEAERGNPNERLFWAGLALVAVLLLGAVALAWADRWRRQMHAGPSGADELAAYRLSYERGELSEDEYRRIRARLGGPAHREPPETPPPIDGPQPLTPESE